MKSYKKVDVAEQQLEDLVRKHCAVIEEGMRYVDHQKKTSLGGRLDVLMVDSGKALVVAELKVVQDDGMLVQGIDYYDYIANNIEAFARLYGPYDIDPTQEVRLFLIAPSFSQSLVNRCKWTRLPVSLFTYVCLKFEGADDIVPVFYEQAIPTPPEAIEITKTEDHLNYITNADVKIKAASLLDEIKNWKPGSISLDSIKYAISMKVNNRVFAYFYPRRKHFLLATYNDQEVWTEYPIKDDGDLENIKPIMRGAMERIAKLALGHPSTSF